MKLTYSKLKDSSAVVQKKSDAKKVQKVSRKQLKFISWDSVTNTMSGVITIMKGILLSLRSLGKNVFPLERSVGG